jgi:hypothetical protein
MTKGGHHGCHDYSGLLVWPGPDARYELDDGVLIVSPAPSNLHQAHVTADEEYHAEIPFPVTITPSRLVSLRR